MFGTLLAILATSCILATIFTLLDVVPAEMDNTFLRRVVLVLTLPAGLLLAIIFSAVIFVDTWKTFGWSFAVGELKYSWSEVPLDFIDDWNGPDV